MLAKDLKRMLAFIKDDEKIFFVHHETPLSAFAIVNNGKGEGNYIYLKTTKEIKNEPIN